MCMLSFPLRSCFGEWKRDGTPGLERPSRTNVGLIFTEVGPCFGQWDGTVLGHPVAGLQGFAEEAQMRW